MTDSKNLIARELDQYGETPTMTPLMLKLEKNRITSATELRPMEFLFTLFGKPCFPRRELVALTGRAKSGKTLVTSMLMALCVADEVLAFKRSAATPGKGLRLLWFDTEQSDNSTQDILKNRIMPLYWRAKGKEAAFPEEMLDIFNVRNVDHDRREELLTAAIAGYKPDLVVLDGIRDLVGDINDGELAQALIERLMTTAQQHDCCIVCVLHQNKSGESRDPRGWLGTELLNKAFDVFATEKLMPQRIFKLEQLYTRKYDIEQCLYFTVDDGGLPMVSETPPTSVLTANAATEQRPTLNADYVIRHADGSWEMDAAKLFTNALAGYDSLNGAALRERVMQLGHIATNSLYRNCLDKAMRTGLLRRSQDQDRHVVYSLTMPATEEPAVVQPGLFPEQQDDPPF